MFSKNDILFYIDLTDGVVEEGKFLSYEEGAIWIKLKDHALNTYVYADVVDQLVFGKKEDAQKGLIEIRAKTKAKLLSNNRYIGDIVEKLSKEQGSFYIGIVKEILEEKS
jgi:hypothetical protein